MDTSGSPVPDAIQPLFEQLQEALLLEGKYQPNLQLPATTQVIIEMFHLFIRIMHLSYAVRVIFFAC